MSLWKLLNNVADKHHVVEASTFDSSIKKCLNSRALHPFLFQTMKYSTNATLNNPFYVVLSSSNQVYISEAYGNRIRKIDQFGIITTIAVTCEEGYNGDNQLAVNSTLNSPCGLFITEDEELLLCDTGSDRVRKIDRKGIITTIAGNGDKGYNGDDQLATLASLQSPIGVFQYKNEIYISDMSSHRIRKIDRRGIIHTIAGNVSVHQTPKNGKVQNFLKILQSPSLTCKIFEMVSKTK